MQTKPKRLKLEIEPKLKNFIKACLAEDDYKIDITSRDFVDDRLVSAEIIAKEQGIVCGMDIAELIFKTVDAKLRVSLLGHDGIKVKCGKVIARIFGRASSILAAERTALNFLSHLSGIATLTNKFVMIAKKHNIAIFDTRKTMPGLRCLEKYAVTAGGGKNHRLALSSSYLIKDNHLKLVNLSDLENRIRQIRRTGTKKEIEVEVKTIDEFKTVSLMRPDVIMLDNMQPAEIKKILCIKKKENLPVLIELSGGINMTNIKNFIMPGIARISLGELTHSAKALDFSLEIT